MKRRARAGGLSRFAGELDLMELFQGQGVATGSGDQDEAFLGIAFEAAGDSRAGGCSRGGDPRPRLRSWRIGLGLGARQRGQCSDDEAHER